MFVDLPHSFSDMSMNMKVSVHSCLEVRSYYKMFSPSPDKAPLECINSLCTQPFFLNVE